MDRQVHACEVLLKQKTKEKKSSVSLRGAGGSCQIQGESLPPSTEHIFTPTLLFSVSAIDPVGNMRRLTFHMLLSLNLDMYANTSTHTYLGTMLTSAVITCPSFSRALQEKKGARC